MYDGREAYRQIPNSELRFPNSKFRAPYIRYHMVCVCLYVFVHHTLFIFPTCKLIDQPHMCHWICKDFQMKPMHG